jgi:hypothetical protein
MSQLGMLPVLPAFSGFIPEALINPESPPVLLSRPSWHGFPAP